MSRQRPEPGHRNGVWSDANLKDLMRLWSEGKSASQCAVALTTSGFRPTRNAVIAKVHRMRAKGVITDRPRKTYSRKRKPTAAQAAFKGPPPRAKPTAPPDFKIEPLPPATPDLVIPEAERRSLAMLMDADCRWPFGDPKTAGFHFCGKGKVPGLPYCEFHARRAYQPPAVTKREPYIPADRNVVVVKKTKEVA